MKERKKERSQLELKEEEFLLLCADRQLDIGTRQRHGTEGKNLVGELNLLLLLLQVLSLSLSFFLSLSLAVSMMTLPIEAAAADSRAKRLIVSLHHVVVVRWSFVFFLTSFFLSLSLSLFLDLCWALDG